MNIQNLNRKCSYYGVVSRYLDQETEYAPFYTGMYLLQRLMAMAQPGEAGNEMIAYLTQLAADRYAEVGMGEE